MRPKAIGRKPKVIGQNLLDQAIAVLFLLGPSAHTSKLEALFPGIPREHLKELKRDYGCNIKNRFRWIVKTLKWTTVGAVWAMDYTKPLQVIEGRFKKILLVRDLASGCTLLTLPVPEESTDVTIQALEALFLEHGIPLVLKCDNGSSFAAQKMQSYLNSKGVLQLFSPPRTPEYNAAVEAGIGSFKVHAHYASAKNDRPGQWTCDDIEVAKATMNYFGQPKGKSNVSPRWNFDSSEKMTIAQRLELWKNYRLKLKEVLKNKNVEKLESLKEMERRSVRREAISSALLDLDYLRIRKRRVSPPFKKLKLARVS